MRADSTTLPGQGNATKDLIMRAIDIPLPGPGDGLRVGRAQHLRLIDEVSDLTAAQWATVTECPEWTARDMVGHVTSAARFQGNPLLFILDAQIGRLRYRGRSALDAANEVGIHRHRSLSTVELLERLRRRALSDRDTPAWMRRRLTNDTALPSYTTIGSFVDTVLTRDTWLHRHDIARAVGRVPGSEPTDAEVVAQVIRDLGLAWTGPDIVLRLTGPEGGTWRLGSDSAAPEAVLPAVPFMRHLSGRVVAADLFDGVPGALRPALKAARVVF